MIQAAYNKPVELKAPKADLPERTKSTSSSKSPAPSKSIESKSKSEASDFESELKAASMSDETEVKPVKVAKEQTLEQPSKLVNPEAAGDSGDVSPKIFDPALTQDVEKAIDPSTVEVKTLTDAEVLKIANGEMPVVEGQEVVAVEGEIKDELTQAMLKTPKVANAGRNPAIELTQAEVDPQLMNMEDFVAQKNAAAAKKAAPVNGYGMNKANVQKMAAENGLKQTQIVNDIQGSKQAADGAVNSQQFILNMQKEQSGTPMSSETHAPAKVFDMSHIKSSSADKIMTQISDYIVQAKAAKEPTVNMRVNHAELGMIDITVQKSVLGANADAVAINIGTHTLDGKNFFQQNSKDLLSHLSGAGLAVSDMKVETPQHTAKNDFDMNHQSGRGGAGQEKNFNSEQNQRRHDSDRRQDLWKTLSDKEAA